MLSTKIFMLKSRINAERHTRAILSGHSTSKKLDAKVNGSVMPDGKKWSNQDQVDKASVKSVFDVIHEGMAEIYGTSNTKKDEPVVQVEEVKETPEIVKVEQEHPDNPEEHKASVIFPEEKVEAEVPQQTSSPQVIVVDSNEAIDDDDAPTEMEKVLKPTPNYRNPKGKKARKAAEAAKEAAKKKVS